MENEFRTGKIARPGHEWACFIGLLALAAVSIVLGRFDTNTEIFPSHENVLIACFALGGLTALLLGGVAIFGRREITTRRRIGLAISCVFLGFLSVFLFSNRVADLLENYIDFPAGNTRTYSTFLCVDRAYRTHGKIPSWNIQTTPIWSNLDITENDYSFMLQHRQPGDDGRNPDEISSRGYFCAHVMMQQSGSALRVLNAGSRKLPMGTVVICPANGSHTMPYCTAESGKRMGGEESFSPSLSRSNVPGGRLRGRDMGYTGGK